MVRCGSSTLALSRRFVDLPLRLLEKDVIVLLEMQVLAGVRAAVLGCKARQNTPPAPFSVLFWPVLEHPQNKRVLFCSATRLHRGGPGEPGGRRGRGWARKRGPLGARPPSPGPRGSAEACGGGDQAKIRGLSDKICSAGGRSLAICAPSAQSARRRH